MLKDSPIPNPEFRKLEQDVADEIVSIFQSSNPNSLTQNRILEAKKEDLKRMKEISGLINSALQASHEEDLIKLLNDIGEIATKITFNNDNKNQYIRNKYGAIGSRSDFTNQGGIEFLNLQALRRINADDIKKIDLKKFKDGLVLIKEKIDLAIDAEDKKMPHQDVLKEFRNKRSENYFVQATRDFYSEKLIADIKEELEFLGDISEPLNQESKYFISRIFAKIGELSKEYLDFNKGVGTSENQEIFLSLRDLRNKINHRPFAFIKGQFDLSLVQQVAKDIQNVIARNGDFQKQNLESLLKIFDVQKGINIQPVEVKEDGFLKELETFVALNREYNQIKLKLEEFLPEEISEQDLINKKSQLEEEKKQQIVEIDKKINAKSISTQEIKNKIKDIPQKIKDITGKIPQLEELLKKFTTQLSEIDDLEKKDSQTLTKKQKALLEKKQEIENESEKKKKEIRDLDKDEDYQKLLQLNKQKEEIDQQNKIKLAPLQKQKSDITTPLDDKIKEIDKKLKEIKNKDKEEKQLKDSKEKLERSIKSGLESILKYHPDLAKIKEAEELPNEEVLDNLSKFITRQKSKLDTKIDVRELISKKLEGIAKEVQYLAQIFQDQNLSGQKKSYISQYCVTIIGQYLKDIFEIEKKYGLAFVSEETKKATLFKESVARTTQVKNKGINHELESFREAEFWQVITDHTVSIQTTIEALQILITSLEVQEDLKEHFSSSFSTSVDLSGLTLEDRKLQELVGCDMPYCFNLGSLFGNIAISHMHLGNYDKAEDFFKKSMEYFDDNKNAERLGINLSKYFVLPFKIRNEEQHLDVVPRLLESDSQIIISYSDEINYAFEKNTLTDLGGKDVIIIPHRNEDLIAKRTIAFNYSLYMHSQGRYEEELQLLQIAKSLEIEFDGKPKLNTISNIVSILHKLGRNDNALKELEKINPENYQGEEKIRALYSLYESLNFEDKNGKKGGTILDEMSYLMSSQSEIKDKELLFLIPYEKALYYSYQECKSSIEKAKILLEEARVRFFENEGFIKNVMGNKFFKDQMLLFVAEIIIFIKDHQYNPKTHEECQAIAKRIMDFNHKSSDLSEPISKSLVESFIEFIFQTYPRGVDLQTWNILQALRESYDIRSPFEDAIIQSYKKIRKPITSSDIEIEIKGDFDFDQIASYLKASFNIDETAITPPESEHDKVFMISLNKEAMELLDKKISTKVNPSNILSPRSEEKFLSVQNNTTLIS